MAAHKRTRIGILGGTFNPIHLGHLLIAQDALELAGLDRVVFIPCASPPHKTPNHLAPARHRLAMARRAIRGDRRFEADDLEIRRGGKSYSVDTLTALKWRHPRAEFYFIIGSDSLPELHRWRDINRLATLCRFVAVSRPGVAPVRANRHDAIIVRGHVCEISSSDIRDRLARGQTVQHLVPAPVFRYIQAHKLYQ